ncbi:MAG: site-2 protease family protein [Cyanobacteria bacterium P01_F01_bin.42]
MTLSLCVLALALIGWGYYRARPFGKLGRLAWLQSVVLMSPWVVVFALLSVGVVVNFASILALIILSIAGYIWLGKNLRSEAERQGVSPGVRFGIPADVSKADVPITTAEAADRSETDSLKPVAVSNEPQPVPSDDLAKMRGIFGIDTFFATETIPYQDGVIFKGNLRGEIETSHRELTRLLSGAVGDRYRLFLVNDQEQRPVVIVLPSRNDPQPMTLVQKGFAVLLAIGTLLTCLTSAAFLKGFDLFSQPNQIAAALPIGLGLFSVLVCHELAHQWMAKRHGVKFSLPFFFPTIQIGSFGALNRFESLIPKRSVLFDVAFAGPAVSGLISFVLVFIGLSLSRADVGLAESTSLLSFPTPLFQGSILVGGLARVFFGEALRNEFVAVHPTFIVGWIGLVITAINLIPAGQLDGGRMVQAVYGRKVAGRTTVISIILLAVAALVNPLALYWAIIILFLQRDLERPTLNDLLEPDDTRALIGLSALLLMVLVLIPLSPGLAFRLGIGM